MLSILKELFVSVPINSDSNLKELFVSQAIRQKQGYVKVTGQLIGQCPVYNMISAVNRDCYNCGYHDKLEYINKPLFKSPIKERGECPNCCKADRRPDTTISPTLKASYEYFSTVDIELQDPDNEHISYTMLVDVKDNGENNY